MKLNLREWPNAVVAKIQKSTRSFKSSFYIQDGEKRKLNHWRIGVFVIPLLVGSVLVQMFWSHSDTSYFNQTADAPIPTQNSSNDESIIMNRTTGLSSTLRIPEASETQERSARSGQPIKYAAKQVIDRIGGAPSGSNFIGKLLTGIDTRDQGQVVKVLLPYGGVYQGVKCIDDGSVLFGRAQQARAGDKVFITFNRLVGPDGTEYEIQAQALNSKDFSSGLVGTFHSNADSRMMAAVGLGMISAAADVLVEKESLGNSYEPTPKSTLKNAGIASVSRAAQMEGERYVSESEDKQDYVTVESGMDLIVSLIQPFRGEAAPDFRR